MGWFRRNEHDEEQLSAYLDGELDARHAENVEHHLATCDTCAALLEELRSMRALLSALPAHTPTRSFVLGAEYARAPVRDVATPSRRFGLALAPAVALSVFVALLFVDVADFSSSSDDSGDVFTAATSREEANDASRSAGSAGAAELAPAAADSATQQQADGFDSAGKSDETADATAAANSPSDGAGGGIVATPEGPPAAAMSAEGPVTPAAGDTAITAAGEADADPAPAPLAFEAPDIDGDDDGISTLRVLQVVAAVAFLASGFYVFVWPRVSRGGS